AALESAQEELVRKEKMAALGQLTATVSHELRNPLGTIRTSVFSIIKKTSPDKLGIAKSLARIDRSITRCDNIISDLLDYTRNRAPKPSPTDVDQWIAELMKEQDVPDWLELEFKLAVENRPVELDQEYIRRAVINLYDNARQALEGGKDGSNGKKPKITIGARIEKKWLKISVKDTGPGMSQEVLDKIFEPLFSTKTYGIGLGLATVRQIVEMNGGTISIKSRLGKGTQALLKLPLNPSPPKKPGAK
ncbi:MAG: GHKL domain-containing protein, partial [SAR324 cluster bacterium]|nr:GHKL domain-containing protein [SAR324 cluster bacterium]